MEENRQYRYFAFISYSRKDERWAKWLQTRLETYHLPAAVRKQHADTPRRIAPVFRDKTDLSGGVLREQLCNELDESRFLILICSPNSAASEWVDREVRRFVESGRAEQIIPFVVDGAADQSVFPPSLRWGEEKSLLGISVQEMGRTAAFLRVVSTMLGLKYDELARRHRKRMVRRCAAAAVATVLALAAAGRAWWYYTPHSAYYANYVTRYEIPEGVNELSAKERQGLSEYYRIVTRKGKPVLLERVNAAGNLTDPILQTLDAEYPRTEFIYNDDGRIARTKLYDEQGRPVLQKSYAYELDAGRIAIDYQQPWNSLQAMTLMGDTSEYYMNGDDGNRSDIARLLNTYDENGFLTESLYLRDNRNTPACDANGVYGVRYGHSGEGLVTETTYLDENGQPHASRYGVAGERYTYDEQGRVVLNVGFGQDGDPVRSKEGYAQMALEYDAIGNLVNATLLDENGALCFGVDRYAGEQIAYDERGMRVGDRYFGADGQPAYDAEWGGHEYRYGYDGQGRVISIDAFDADGEPMYDLSGAAGTRFSYDEQGRIKEIRYVDTQGELCPVFNGIAGVNMAYDGNGYLQSYTAIGADGGPYMTDSGRLTFYQTCDEQGNRLREETLDENGGLMEDVYGVAVTTYEYDSVGNMVSESYFDSQERPCLRKGCSTIRYSYKDGNCVSERYFGLDDEPVSPQGWHEKRMEYDGWGNVRCITYFDEQSALVTQGPARLELVSDSYGNELERSYYDADGEPYQYDGSSESYWRQETEYDRWGDVIRTTCYSLTGQYRRGYATTLSQYDERHNLVREEYLDENGQTCTDDDGASVLFNTYDERNLLLRQEYLGEDGQPGNGYGISAIERQYDERGRLTRDVYYRPDGSGGETMECQRLYTYDEHGEIASKNYQYSDGAEHGTLYPVKRVEASAPASEQAGIIPGSVVLLWNSWEYFDYDIPIDAVRAFKEKRQDDSSDSVLLFAATEQEDGQYSIVYHILDREEAEQMQIIGSSVTENKFDQISEAYMSFLDRLTQALAGGDEAE